MDFLSNLLVFSLMFHFSHQNSDKHVAERKLPKHQEGWVAVGRGKREGPASLPNR